MDDEIGIFLRFVPSIFIINFESCTIFIDAIVIAIHGDNDAVRKHFFIVKLRERIIHT